MTQHSTTNDVKYQQFIEQVVATGSVWGLSQGEAWATSSSAEYEDADVILFWSDEASAAACATDDWEEYNPEAVSIEEFLENWCVGMYDDHLLAGPNWSEDLLGDEVEPLELALHVVQELKQKNKPIHLTQYDNEKDFENQLLEALATED